HVRISTRPLDLLHGPGPLGPASPAGLPNSGETRAQRPRADDTACATELEIPSSHPHASAARGGLIERAERQLASEHSLGGRALSGQCTKRRHFELLELVGDRRRLARAHPSATARRLLIGRFGRLRLLFRLL